LKAASTSASRRPVTATSPARKMGRPAATSSAAAVTAANQPSGARPGGMQSPSTLCTCLAATSAARATPGVGARTSGSGSRSAAAAASRSLEESGQAALRASSRSTTRAGRKARTGESTGGL
jgi:hypothetical protein